MEILEKIQLIKSEIYRSIESEIMWESLDEYLSSAELILFVAKLVERYGFESESERARGDSVQDNNVRCYIWIGIQKIELSGFMTLRLIADTITATLSEEIEKVNRESTYYKEVIPKDTECSSLDKQINTFEEILKSVSNDRSCDERFADFLKNTGFSIGKAVYCGCKDTYYVEAEYGKRIWFNEITAKNEENPVNHRRPRIEVLYALVDKKFHKTI